MMTTQERIDSWKCEWGKDNVTLKLNDNIDWDKYGFDKAEVSINNNDNFVLIKSGIFGHSRLNLDLSSSYSYTIELRSNFPNVTCGTKIPNDIEEKFPTFYGYTKVLYKASGIYELDKNNGKINFYEINQFDYIGDYLPNELRSIIHNPLAMLDDEELSTFIPALIELFHLDGNEINKNAQFTIDACINSMQYALNKIRIINNDQIDNSSDILFLNRLRNEMIEYASSIKK